MTAALARLDDDRTTDRAASRPALMLALALALIVGIAGRLAGGWDTPLWFDETFSAVIATQPDLPSLIRWCLSELSGPVYYGTLWGWEKLAGDSDLALRLPSFAFSLAAPALILWKGHPDRATRLIWAALVLLWTPGFSAAADARPRALLFLLATAQSIAFLALLRRPDRGRAFAWTTFAALAVLTHYHAAVIAGAQGLLYLALKGRAAVRTWPAALVLVPMAAWMAWHLPLLIGFAQSGAAWEVWRADAVIELPRILFGESWLSHWLALVILATLPATLARAAESGERALAWSGVVAIALIFTAAFILPGFMPRYLLSAMPAMLFAVALWLRALATRFPLAPAAALALLTGVALEPVVWRFTDGRDDIRHVYTLAPASRWIAEREAPERLLFFWDGATSAASDANNVAEVGGFHFRRAGHDVRTEAWRPDAGGDPKPALLAAAAAHRGSALIWLADRRDPEALGPRHGFDLTSIDPRWRCRDHGGDAIVVIACIPEAGAGA